MWETVFPSGHVTHQWGKCELGAQLWRTVWAGNWGFVVETIKVDAREGCFSATEKLIYNSSFLNTIRFVFRKLQECVFVPGSCVRSHY